MIFIHPKTKILHKYHKMPPKKQTIPKALKIAVWHHYIGEDIGKTKCLCCNITEITQMKFHCGHIIAEANGGTISIENLVPICETCNKSMRIRGMNEFKKLLVPPKLLVPQKAISQKIDTGANLIREINDYVNYLYGISNKGYFSDKESDYRAYDIYDNVLNNCKCPKCSAQFLDSRRGITNGMRSNFRQIYDHMDCLITNNKFVKYMKILLDEVTQK
jgi:hypothetical protein